MKLVRTSLLLDGREITQGDLEEFVARQRGCVVRPQVITPISGGPDEVDEWLTAKRHELVIAWLTNVPLELEGWPVHFSLEVSCELWTAGRAGNAIDAAIRLLPNRLPQAQGPTMWVKTLPSTVDGELAASPAGVMYTTAGLTLHLAYNRYSQFALEPIGRPTPWRVAAPVGMPD